MTAVLMTTMERMICTPAKKNKPAAACGDITDLVDLLSPIFDQLKFAKGFPNFFSSVFLVQNWNIYLKFR